jgi:hypothetical protein
MIPRSMSTTPLLLGAVLVLAAAASPGAVRAEGAEPVGQICRSVLRTKPGQAQYDGCVESLSGSLRSLGQGRAVGAAHETCLARGLPTGTPALAECTLAGAQTQPAALDTSAASATLMQNPGGSKSWFSISNGDRLRREQLACARLGLDPVSGGFDSCVAGLRATLFELDNPSN